MPKQSGIKSRVSGAERAKRTLSPSDISPGAIYLIDASIYFFRSYFSLPDRWQAKNGISTNGTYGYTQFLLQLIEARTPQMIAVAFDESLGTCFRHELYPEYKISRPMPDEEITFQLKACREVTGLLGMHHAASENYEADDLLATFAKKMRRTQRQIVLVTRDKDLGQIMQKESDFFYDYASEVVHDRASFYDKMGVYPEQLVDYLTLVGDSVDDIPGVPGIGAKTAIALLTEFGSIDEIYRRADELALLPIRGAKKLAEKFELYEEQIDLVKQLTKTVETVPMKLVSKDLQWKKPKIDPLIEFYREMGFGANAEKRLLKVVG